jgi:hypothetical protein
MDRSQPVASAASDEDDDYMNMTFAEPHPQQETSLQRRQRLKREGEIRGMVKSKEQLVAEEAEAREKALSRSLLEEAAAKKSKGLSMMAKMGFKGGALGSKDNKTATLEPIKLNIKGDRGGVGLESENKRKLEEAFEKEGKTTAKPVDPLEYRDRVRRAREQVRIESQVHAVQRVAEQMDEERLEEEKLELGAAADERADAKEHAKKKPRTVSSRPLKSVNVLWRGLVRHREEVERDRRMRHDLEQSLSRLPTYEDEDEDEDDRRAMGKVKTVYVTADDLDEEDAELDAFNALEGEERLRRLVEHLRKKHRYCIWCKFTYPDEAMDGCPGLTEEEHD